MSLDHALLEMLGPKGWLTKGIASWQTDWMKYHAHTALGVARPVTTEQVASVLKLASAAGVSVVPQGGNTSLCGGAVPDQPGCIILSLARMQQIAEIDPLEFSVIVEAGAVLSAVHDAAAKRGRMFPMHLGSEGSAQIGGLISTNAGGSHALRYGMMKDLVLGMEVVLPDGRIWNGLRPLMKDNAGYQLRQLFCGAEGTLGVITRAALRLFPAPASTATTLLAVPDYDALVVLGAKLRAELGDFISALEFFSDIGLDMALRHVSGLTFPLTERALGYVLVELSTSARSIDLDTLLETALTEGFENGLIADGAVAANETHRKTFWRLREEMPEGQRLEGAQLKHDISVPTAKIGQFIAHMAPMLDVLLPGVRVNPFGHLGDGNIHYNLSPPIGHVDFGGLQQALSTCIYHEAEAIGGSFAAEHGLGRSKVSYADHLRSSEERALMAAIKAAIDPEALLNPGVLTRRAATTPAASTDTDRREL
jgi:FAD/FMN-containing dehydrogenase